MDADERERLMRECISACALAGLTDVSRALRGYTPGLDHHDDALRVYLMGIEHALRGMEWVARLKDGGETLKLHTAALDAIGALAKPLSKAWAVRIFSKGHDRHEG
jgi:hypothetical protein